MRWKTRSLLKLPKTLSSRLETLTHPPPDFPCFLHISVVDCHISNVLYGTGQTKMPLSPQFLLF